MEFQIQFFNQTERISFFTDYLKLEEPFIKSLKIKIIFFRQKWELPFFFFLQFKFQIFIFKSDILYLSVEKLFMKPKTKNQKSVVVISRIFKESDDEHIYHAKLFKNEVVATATNSYLEKSPENHLFVPTYRFTNWVPDRRTHV